MFDKTIIKNLSLQTPENKVYVLKLIAHQILGEQWVYYRKIKRGDQGFSLFKEKSLMEQMKATRAALRFTTRNARKLYKTVYQDCIKDIKTFTGLKTEFPEVADEAEGEMPPALTSDQDAVIISWTPVKFFLPVLQLRAKGMATQRHTEGLATKLFFKVVGYYADPSNWDKYKLNLYLRKLTKNSSYQEIVSELAPLKNDLDRLIEVYEPFKFGKASLSKDIATESDSFDDAMGVDSFESQLKTLYWHHFIYLAMEFFLFRYYLVLITSTPSREALRYLTVLFEPILQKAIEIKNIFLGSFETDRTKRSFRVPYQKLVSARACEPMKKNIRTQMGVFETYTYNLPLLEKNTLNFELEKTPEQDSEWWMFIKHHILNIQKPPLFPEKIESDNKEGKKPGTNDGHKALDEEKKKLQTEIDNYIQIKKRLVEKKSQIEKSKQDTDSLNKEARVIIEEQKSQLLKEELKLDKEGQKLKERYQKIESRQNAAALAELEERKRLESMGPNKEEIQQIENEISDISVRQHVLLNMMVILIVCNQLKRLARYGILERFKQRVKNDQELEVKRIEEIRKQAEKKLRDLKKRKSQMERLKQQDTVGVLMTDIEKFQAGIDDRIEIIKQDSLNELQSQKERLNVLFSEISKEKSLSLGSSSKVIWRVIQQIEPEGEFIAGIPSFVSNHIQNNYVKEYEPFYKNIFNIFDLQISEKMLMIQSLEKSGGEKAIRLVLNEGEEKQYQDLIQSSKEKIEKHTPGVFDCKVVFLTNLILVNDLFRLSLDSKSLNALLLLKVVSPKSTQNFNLKGETVKELMELNKLINPMQKNRIIQQGRENDKNPEKRLNSAMLTSLLNNLN
ncbi:hypothetical protein KJ966_26205 [bacterium]|nr:hypothetical protein [bacterium]